MAARRCRSSREPGREQASWDVETPAEVVDYRDRLSRGENVVDPETWAGRLPAAGIAPRLRVGRDRWFNLLWLLPIGFVLLLVAVAAAKGLREHARRSQAFIARHPGTGYATRVRPCRTARLGRACSTS